MDNFRLIKNEIAKRGIPVRIAWEIHEMDRWSLELEEKSSAQRFRIDGDASISINDLLRHIESTAKQLKKRSSEF